MSKRTPPPLGKYAIVCPHCREQETFELTGEYTNLNCEKCDESFEVFLAKIRAKRGRKSKNVREYVLRYYSRSGEDVIRFTDHGGSDLDLRSGDIFYLAYKNLNESPDVICNVTTNNYAEIARAQEGCFIATVTCGYNSIEVKTLSLFRDNILKKNIWGQLFTSNYYRFSPYLASYIEDRGTLKIIIRMIFVTPISTIFSNLFHLGIPYRIPPDVDGKPTIRKNNNE